MNRYTCFCFILVLFPHGSCLSSFKTQTVENFLSGLAEENEVLGASVLVQKEKEVFSFSTGFLDFKKTKPHSVDSIAHICSNSKPIVAAALFQLLEQGKLSLNDPLAKYVPEFSNVRVVELCSAPPGVPIPEVQNEQHLSLASTPLADNCTEGYRLVPAKNPITIMDLLGHKSGFCYGEEFRDFWGVKDKKLDVIIEKMNEVGFLAGVSDRSITLSEEIRRATQVPLMSHPGEEFHYGPNIDILGYVIEKISNLSLGEYLKVHFFEPLGMNDTKFFFFPESDQQDLERMDRLCDIPYKDRSGYLHSTENLSPGSREYKLYVEGVSNGYSGKRALESGGSGLYSTAKDYNRFLRMLLNNGKPEGKQTPVLSQSSIDMILQNRLSSIKETMPDYVYSLGNFFIVQDNRNFLFNTGTAVSQGFHGTKAFLDPKENLSMVLITQCNGYSPSCKMIPATDLLFNIIPALFN